MAVGIATGAVAHIGGSGGFAIGRRSRHNFPKNLGLRFLPYKDRNLFPGRVLGKYRVQPEPVARSLTHRPCMRYNRYKQYNQRVLLQLFSCKNLFPLPNTLERDTVSIHNITKTWIPMLVMIRMGLMATGAPRLFAAASYLRGICIKPGGQRFGVSSACRLLA
ncbi:hypothetical protein EVAR_2720_1 [Eumeta japonica]|uniref:Uncharacterized protein n=1 Tax=Eumeta variegata TaxID=151549 RepID=A0A4C1T0B7_EUMVA|nr:hypothetical protein EVAR_2720_1 [Eumeta japonica]